MEIVPMMVSVVATGGAVLSTLILGGLCLPAYRRGERHLMVGPQFAEAVSASIVALLFAIGEVNVTMKLWVMMVIAVGTYMISFVWAILSYRKGYLSERFASQVSLAATICMGVSVLAYGIPRL